MFPALLSLPTRLGYAGAHLLVVLSLSACAQAARPSPAARNAEVRDYALYSELVWSDEFTGSGALDPAKWTYDTGNGSNGWGNHELENYTSSPDNVAQRGGNLVIQASQQPGGAYTSARVLTKGRQNFQYGRLDVRAKLPKGQGIWPAIWLLGADIDQVNWPACGEIDVMELRGQDPTEILTTLHYGTSPTDHRYKGADHVRLRSGGSFADDFHIYSVVRSQDQLQFFLDGQPYYTFASSEASPNPFHNPFFVVLNVAVGGDFVQSPDASTVFPQQMLVDYVRFYQYK